MSAAVTCCTARTTPWQLQRLVIFAVGIMALINELLLLIFPTEIKLVLKIFIEDGKIDKHAAVKHQG